METARNRRSVRRYLEVPVEPEVLDSIMEAACWAPSPQNRQGWKFTVIADKEKISGFAHAVRKRWDNIGRELGGSAVSEEIAGYSSNFSWFENAPVLIVVSARRPESFISALFGEDAAAVSGSFASGAMAAENLMLAAHSAGLGSCCITGALAAADEINDLTGLGGRWANVCIISIGYPGELPEPPPRKSLEEVAIHI